MKEKSGRTWAEKWTVDKQRYREQPGPVFTGTIPVFPELLPVSEALVQGHLDYQVALSEPSLAAAPVEGLNIPTYLIRGPIPGVDPQAIVMQEPVNPPYLIRQPAEVMSLLDDFLPIKACGPLPHTFKRVPTPVQGARFMVVLEAGEGRLFSSHLEHYILLKEPTCVFDETLTMQYCPGWNHGKAMLSMDNLSSGVTPVMPVRRTATWERDLEGIINYFRLMARSGFQEFMALFKHMAKRLLTEQEVYGILEQVYYPLAIPAAVHAKTAMGLALSLEDRYANEKALVQNRYQVEHYPEVAIMLYRKTGAEHPDLANSALCLYLAICEFEDTR
jgi:hypothetical protein